MRITKTKAIAALRVKLAEAQAKAKRESVQYQASNVRYAVQRVTRAEKELVEARKRLVAARKQKPKPVTESDFVRKLNSAISMIEMTEGDSVPVGSIPNLKYLLF